MAFTVHGYIKGVAYSLTVGNGHPDGTQNVMDLLEDEVGLTHSATPTGPSALLDPADPESVLIALTQLTEIVSVDGDPPTLDEPGPAGAVY